MPRVANSLQRLGLTRLDSQLTQFDSFCFIHTCAPVVLSKCYWLKRKAGWDSRRLASFTLALSSRELTARDSWQVANMQVTDADAKDGLAFQGLGNLAAHA